MAICLCRRFLVFLCFYRLSAFTLFSIVDFSAAFSFTFQFIVKIFLWKSVFAVVFWFLFVFYRLSVFTLFSLVDFSAAFFFQFGFILKNFLRQYRFAILFSYSALRFTHRPRFTRLFIFPYFAYILFCCKISFAP